MQHINTFIDTNILILHLLLENKCIENKEVKRYDNYIKEHREGGE